jgi:eukaryotic-like serine/threonine-protein kinase
MNAQDTVAIGPGVELRDGRYRLERVLGIGGMASVWLGLDQRLDRPVAVKVLSDTLASDPEYVRRFRREAQTAARLSHPNLVKVFDFEPKGRPALVMEYVDGGTLAETANRPDTAVEVEALASQLLGALEHIHAAGIVHRDVKPANVLITKDGRALLTDFGIAQHEDATRITQTGQVIGTLRYMAPEVHEGERATARSDLYSCGMLLRDYIDADSPAGLRQLVDRLSERDPQLRPESAKRALSYLAGSSPSAAAAADRAAVTTRSMRTPAPRDTEEMPAVAEPEREREESELAPDRTPPPPPPEREAAISGRHVLAALALLAAVVAVIVVVTSSGGDGGGADSGGQQDSPPTAESPAEEGAAAPEPSSSEPIPPPAADADPDEGVALNDQAYDVLTSQGDPEGAVDLYEQALAQFPTEQRTTEAFDTYPQYAYALYSYADALLQVGRADEAVAVLKERREFADQRDTVDALLAEAKDAAKAD